MSGPASRLQVTLIVLLVTLAAASVVLHRWWARRADQAVQARYRELRRGMSLSEAEQVLGKTPHQPSLHPTDIVTTAAYNLSLGDPEAMEYSNGSRYRIVLKLDRKNQTISDISLYYQDSHFLRQIIDDIKIVMPSKRNTATLP